VKYSELDREMREHFASIVSLKVSWDRLKQEWNAEHGYPEGTDVERLPRYFWTAMEGVLGEKSEGG